MPGQSVKPRICVFGAGAIGGWIGAKLAFYGNNVSMVARGRHYEALAKHGITCIDAGGTRTVDIQVTKSAEELPAQDIVIVTTKAHAIPDAIDSLIHLLNDDGVMVTAVNGLPWWYFHRLDSPFAERPLHSVDPDGVLWHRIGAHRTIGCVVYPSVEVIEPGVLRHLSDSRLLIGEPSGETTERIELIASILESGDFRAPIRRQIRNDIWLKVMGNLAFNPISVLTGGLLNEMATDPGVTPVVTEIMDEIRAIGGKLGVRFGVSNQRRMQGAAAVGGHRTSMLQDFESGRPLETAAIIDAVREVAELVDVPTPTINMIDALLRLRVQTRELRPNS